jgi:hypothetical protein
MDEIYISSTFFHTLLNYQLDFFHLVFDQSIISRSRSLVLKKKEP